jgi:hypothetical protein
VGQRVEWTGERVLFESYEDPRTADPATTDQYDARSYPAPQHLPRSFVAEAASVVIEYGRAVTVELPAAAAAAAPTAITVVSLKLLLTAPSVRASPLLRESPQGHAPPASDSSIVHTCIDMCVGGVAGPVVGGVG